MTITTQVFPGSKTAGGARVRPDAPAARLWRGVLCVWALLSGAGALAADSAALYEAVVPVAGYDAPARDQALSAGLSEVLVRVSGDQKAPQHPALARVLANAQRLVQRFNYETVPAAEPESAPEAAPDAAAVAPQPPPAQTLTLHAIYDAPGVGRVLRAAGFNVWGDRPQTVLWLALDAGADKSLIGADAPLPLGRLLNSAAARRGLPLLYPLLDLEDQQALQFSDVAEPAAERIRNAALRYQPDAVLAGYVHVTGGASTTDAATADTAPAASPPEQYEARWTLYGQAGVSNWTAQGSLRQVIDAGIDGAADQLAQRAPALPAGDGGVQLRVAGITDLNRYGDVLRYLGGIPAVTQVQTRTVEPTVVTFSLQLSGTPQALQEALARGALLVPETGAPADSVLRYRIAQ